MIPKIARIMIVSGVTAALVTATMLWMQENARMSKLRHKRVWETIVQMTQTMHQGIRAEQLRPDTVENYFAAHLPVKKTCSANALKQGCWHEAQGRLQAVFQTVLPEETYPGMILDNGCVIAGLESKPLKEYRNPFLLDWNGKDGPNQIGHDQLYLELCLDKRQCGSSREPGMIMPVFSVSGAISTENQRLYDMIFRLSI